MFDASFLTIFLLKYMMKNINKLTSTKLLLIKNISIKINALTSKMNQSNMKTYFMTLCVYLHKKVHIDLLPGSKLVHHRAYPILCVHEQIFKKELQHMVDIDILELCSALEWTLPFFIIPIKDGRFRQITNLHSLNKCVICRKHPLSAIHDIMQHVSGYKYFTKLNILMHYNFQLDEESQVMCVIIMPFGKYEYKCLQMGHKCALDFMQQIVEEVLWELDHVHVYLANINLFAKTWKEKLIFQCCREKPC